MLHPYKILDKSKASMTTWQEGGCWILADALSKYFNIPIYVVYNNTLEQVEHFIVFWGKFEYLDSDGFQSSQQLINLRN